MTRPVPNTRSSADDTVPQQRVPVTSRAKGRNRFGRTVRWSFVAEAGGQVMTLLVGLALAALVGPDAYGLVAMATAYVLFIDLVQRQGIVSAIIQRHKLRDEHLDAAFWMVLGTSLAMTAISLLLAGWWSSVVGEPVLAVVVVALSALLPLKALTIVQEAILRRQLAFRKVALRTTASVGIGGVAGLISAWVEPTVWAFVVQQLVTAASGLVLLWAVSRWRPRMTFSPGAAKDLLGFSTGSLASSLGVFASNRADVLALGVFFGPTVVGVYAVCARVSDSLSSFALRPMQAVALPELSRFQQSPGTFTERLARLERTTALVGLPALGVAVAAAEPLLLVLGPQWSSGVLALKLLYGVAAVRVITGLNGVFLQALGRPFLQAAVTWVAGVGTVASVMIAGAVVAGGSMVEQVSGIATVRLVLMGVLILPLHLALLRLLLRRAVTSSLRPHLTAAIGSLAAIGAGVAVVEWARLGGWPPWVQLLGVPTLAALSAVVTLVLADRGLRKRVVRRREPARTGRHRSNTRRHRRDGRPDNRGCAASAVHGV